MLELTEKTIEAVNDFAKQPDVNGLRIFGDSSAGDVALSAAFVPGPEEGDKTLEEDGALVFLDAEAVKMLDDKRLDARIDDGHVRLTLLNQ